MNMQAKLGLTDFVSAVYHCSDLAKYQDLMQQLKEAETQNCPPSSIIALYFINDLYSQASSDYANINRITTNLEAFAEDLYTTSRFIRALSFKAQS
ncbi:MAG: hypothetical protein KC422_19775 [Trueperaceae bacterium]|nr:hypothetical protein [Trueperaceae bacterium]